MRLKDKTAIVTGGGAGIGRGIALMFAKEGANVIIADWKADGGEQTVNDIIANGGLALFVQVDVSRAEDTQRMVETAVEAWNRLDILVNNAGIVHVGSATNTSVEEWDRVLNINLKGVFLCAKAAIPAMKASGGGAIVNIASVGGLVGPAEMVAYGSAKAGVLNLTRQLAVDYGPDNIRVNSICPGTISTEMHRAFYSEEEAEQVLTEWAQMRPLRRVGTPRDIAYAALYLASEEANFVTGANLIVDGGLLAGSA